jgi:hypothetical protein
MSIGPQEVIIVLLLIIILFGISWAVKYKRHFKPPGSTNVSTKDKSDKA